MGGLATAAMCLLLVSRGAYAAYAGVGLLLSLAFLTKQNAAPYVVAPAAYVVILDRERAIAKLACLAAASRRLSRSPSAPMWRWDG